MKLWTLIPAIMILTAFYLILGNNGYWNYTVNDWLIGNGIISLGVCFVYVCEGIYKIKGDKK